MTLCDRCKKREAKNKDPSNFYGEICIACNQDLEKCMIEVATAQGTSYDDIYGQAFDIMTSAEFKKCWVNQ